MQYPEMSNGRGVGPRVEGLQPPAQERNPATSWVIVAALLGTLFVLGLIRRTFSLAGVNYFAVVLAVLTLAVAIAVVAVKGRRVAVAVSGLLLWASQFFLAVLPAFVERDEYGTWNALDGAIDSAETAIGDSSVAEVATFIGMSLSGLLYTVLFVALLGLFCAVLVCRTVTRALGTAVVILLAALIQDLILNGLLAFEVFHGHTGDGPPAWFVHGYAVLTYVVIVVPLLLFGETSGPRRVAERPSSGWPSAPRRGGRADSLAE